MSVKARYITITIFITYLISCMFFQPLTIQAETQGEGKLVYIIPIEKEVERGLEAFLKRSTNEAKEAGANHIIFEIDTPGEGLIQQIKLVVYFKVLTYLQRHILSMKLYPQVLISL